MDALDFCFENYSRCAYRLEILPEYSIYDTNEYSEYQRFIKGEVIDGFSNQEWLDCITQWKNEGKTIKRVRVVPSPLTDYFKYEFLWCYPRNIKYGEQISFISYDTFESICRDSVLTDFWAFDEDSVILLKYNDNYEYNNCFQVSQEDTNSYLSILKKLQAKAIDYEQCKKRLLW